MVADPDPRDIAFQDLADLLRLNGNVQVFERTTSGALSKVNIKFVNDLAINGQIANSVTDFDSGKIYVLKDGRIVKNYTDSRQARVVMAKFISQLPGFLPVSVENNSFTYDAMKHSFSEAPVKYVYQLLRAMYQLHRRGLCHLKLSPSSIGVVNGELMISDYESARACYSSLDSEGVPIYLRDIQDCGRLICFMTTGKIDETTSEFKTLVDDCLSGKIARITRALQNNLFKDMLDLELVSVRPAHVYLASRIVPSREASVKLSQLLSRQLEPSVSQSLALEILLMSDVYDLELARELVTGVSSGSNVEPGELDSVIDALVQLDFVGSMGHLIEAYGSGSNAYRAMLSLYALSDIDRVYFAGVADSLDARLRGVDPSPDVEDVAPGDDIAYAKRLKIAQPVLSGLTKQELDLLSS